MDYFGILKKAYEITIKHRFLWIFAILAGGAGATWGMSFPSNSVSYSDKWDKYFNSVGQVQLEHFWLNYWSAIAAIIGLILAFSLVWLVLSTIAKGSLLGSVESIQKGQKFNFRLGFNFGWHKFWRILAVSILVGLIIILSILALILPVILFVLAKVYALAVIYGILFFFFDLALWLYLRVMYPYIQRTAVLGDLGSWEAIASSWSFFKKHFKDIAVIYLLLIAVSMVFGAGMLLVLLVLGGLLFAIGLALYLASQMIFWLYVVSFGLIFLLLIIVLKGIFGAFNSSVLTLVYLELTRDKA